MSARRILALLVLLAAVAATSRPSAQGQASTQVPKGQLPDLGRPTQSTDKQPLFDFDTYFIGTKWKFEWDVPEGPLGPEGTVSGTITYKRVADRFYEADTVATGAWGPFTVHEVITYDKEYKSASRHVTDSRGFSYMQVARVGGDLGGYYSFYWEGAPFTFKGQTFRLKTDMRLFSPAQ
jgi:hypothetical protein